MEKKKKGQLGQALSLVTVCLLLFGAIVMFSSFGQAEDEPVAAAAERGTETEELVIASSPIVKPEVYYTSRITSEGLMDAYEALGHELPGKVAVKLSTGEPGGNYFLDANLIKPLVQEVNGTIVECNTAYGGGRISTAMHKQVAIDHGFTAIADVDIMDEEGEIELPFPQGKNIQKDIVGSHFANYDSFVILSHFKGHAMGGFGGAFKNMSIGIASPGGKSWIHTAGKTNDLSIMWQQIRETEQDHFLESMAEAAGAVMNSLGDNIIYISVMNNLSVDCDCSNNPAEPTMADVGILASLDPVALDKACVDLVYAAHDGHDLIERMESRHGIHTIDHAAELNLGSLEYELVDLDA